MSEMVSDQTVFNFLVGILATIGGWFMSEIWGQNKDLRKKMDENAASCKEQERNIYENYMRIDAFHNYMAQMRDQLNRIENILVNKADKP